MAKGSRDTDREKRGKIESEISTFFRVLEEKYGVDRDYIVDIISPVRAAVEAEARPGHIPLCIIKDRRLSALEAITKFMKENLGMRYTAIASELGRNPGTIGITYRKASAKTGGAFEVVPGIDIPTSIFKGRKLSVLESIVRYLKDEGMSLHEIAIALNRDDRTIWTVNHRAEQKAGKTRR